MEVEIETEDGQPMTAVECRQLLDMLGRKVFCEECADSDEVRLNYRER